MEKYSEAKIHKSKPEPRNGNNQNILISCTEFAYNKQVCNWKCWQPYIPASSLEYCTCMKKINTFCILAFMLKQYTNKCGNAKHDV